MKTRTKRNRLQEVSLARLVGEWMYSAITWVEVLMDINLGSIWLSFKYSFKERRRNIVIV